MEETKELLSFEELWLLVKVKAKQVPFVFSSNLYAHKEAAEAIGKEYLPEELRPEFKEHIWAKIKGYSNYAGD